MTKKVIEKDKITNPKIIFLLASLSVLLSCHSQNIPSSAEFDKSASEYFVQNYELFDLSPLDEREKCILKNQVMNDLRELNPSKMVVLDDKYLVKSYFSDFLHLHFGFIKDLSSTKMYFMCLPQLSKFLFDVQKNYARENDSIYTLKVPRRPIKVNTSLLNDFFFAANYKIGEDESIPHEVHRANQIIDEAFSPFFQSNKASMGDLLDAIEMDLKEGLISASSYRAVRHFMEDDLSGRMYSLEVYDFEDAGFLIHTYFFNKQMRKVMVEMYFLPTLKRREIARYSLNKYKNCNLATNK